MFTLNKTSIKCYIIQRITRDKNGSLRLQYLSGDILEVPLCQQKRIQTEILDTLTSKIEVDDFKEDEKLDDVEHAEVAELTVQLLQVGLHEQHSDTSSIQKISM